MGKAQGNGESLYSVSALARLFRLDRGTIARRLERVVPARSDTKGKFYELSKAAPALARPVEASAAAGARQRKVETEAELLGLRLRREQGEVLPVREVREYAQTLFRSLHQRIGVRFPREVAAQLYRAESEAQIAEVLQHDLGRIFNELRQDHTKLLTVEESGGGEDDEQQDKRG